VHRQTRKKIRVWTTAQRREQASKLEKQYSALPRTSAERPKVLRALADAYAFLESALFRDKIKAEIKTYQNKGNPTAKARLRALANTAKQAASRARRQAIAFYAAHAKQYAKWCRFPQRNPDERDCGDEVLWRLAKEYDNARDGQNARRVLEKLVDQWPRSKRAATAYNQLGSFVFEGYSSQKPPQWQAAQKAFEKALRYPPPRNTVYAEASYKLAFVFWNLGKLNRALTQFKKVINTPKRYPKARFSRGFARSARRDLATLYAQVGVAANAYTFFKPLSGDKAGSDKETFRMMATLGTEQLELGKHADAMVIWGDLVRRHKGDESCNYKSKLTAAAVRQAKKKSNAFAALTEQVKTHQAYQKATHPADQKLQCGNETAVLLLETAVTWHLEAVGTGGIRGTGDRTTMNLAAQLYKLTLDTFSDAEIEAFNFPKFGKAERPTASKIRYALADLLYFGKKWDECGPAFDKVAEDPQCPNTVEAAYAAVLCYQNAQLQKRGANSPLDSSFQQRMLAAFSRYICLFHPSASDRDGLSRLAEAKYERARTYYQAKRWEQAAAAFRDIAFNHGKTAAGVHAAVLYLESLQFLRDRKTRNRAACRATIERDAAKLVNRYCASVLQKEVHPDQCDRLLQIRRDGQSKKAGGEH